MTSLIMVAGGAIDKSESSEPPPRFFAPRRTAFRECLLHSSVPVSGRSLASGGWRLALPFSKLALLFPSIQVL